MTALRGEYTDDPEWRDITVILFTHELAFDIVWPAGNITVNDF